MRLLFHADLVGQFDELLQIPPLLFAHQSSIRTRKIDRDESFGRERRTDNQLCFLVLRQWFGHGRFLQEARILSRKLPAIFNKTSMKIRRARPPQRRNPGTPIFRLTECQTPIGRLASPGVVPYGLRRFKTRLRIRGSAARVPTAVALFHWTSGRRRKPWMAGQRQERLAHRRRRCA